MIKIYILIYKYFRKKNYRIGGNLTGKLDERKNVHPLKMIARFDFLLLGGLLLKLFESKLYLFEDEMFNIFHIKSITRSERQSLFDR